MQARRSKIRWGRHTLILLLVCGPGSPAARATCTGDCDGGGSVRIDELVRGVRIALGAPLASCPSFDGNRDGRVTIDELVSAVRHALAGCPATPTASPSVPPSATPTPTARAERAVRFVDVTEGAGIGHAYRSTGYTDDPFAAMLPAGVAADDFDGDGWIDLYLAASNTRARLYRNRGDGTFTAVTDNGADIRSLSSGPLAADLDGDGTTDLVVGGAGGDPAHLFRGAGEADLDDVTTAAGLDGPGFSDVLSSAAADYDRDGDLDLAVAGWGRPAATRVRLWRNDGSGRFVPDDARAGLEHEDDTPDPVLDVAFTDLDEDGWPDLLLATQPGPSRFHRNQQGRFATAQAVPGGAGGHGLLLGDLDRDGTIDWLTTGVRNPGGAAASWDTGGNHLFVNDGNGALRDTSESAGIGESGWSWGGCVADFDNDGHLDLLLVSGFGRLDFQPGFALWDATPEFHAGRITLFLATPSGSFVEHTREAGLNVTGQGRGASCFDYDRDGDVDALLVENGGPARLFRNEIEPPGNSLQVVLHGRAPNTGAIGARVQAAANGIVQAREIHARSAFVGQSPALAHFGLGDADRVDTLRVIWPDGSQSTWSDLSLPAWVRADQESDSLQPWTAEPPAGSTPFVASPTPTASPSATHSPRPTPSPLSWKFVDVTDESGISATHGYRGYKDNDLIALQVVMFMGGVAAGDYDGDGWPDLFFVGGSHARNRLLRNAGDGTFTDVTAAAGIDPMTGNSSGPVFADVDGDGRLDLFLGGASGTRPRLLHNRDGERFDDISVESGLIFPDDAESLGAAFGDLDGDGDLDMFVTHWGSAAEDPLHLWRNQGEAFEPWRPVGMDPAVFRDRGRDTTFSAAFSDIDNDGRIDLLVAADFNHSQYFLNREDGLFRATTAVISDENGMGHAIFDANGDGLLDWFVTSIWDPDGTPSGNRLYRNLGDGSFADATDAAGVRIGYWGWGACAQDFDNDGWVDLLHVNGAAAFDFDDSSFFFGGDSAPFFNTLYATDPARLFLANGDGTFTESATAAGIADRGQGRGVVCFDYDRDGDIDVLIANNGQPARLYRNEGGDQRSFLQVRLRGRAPNTEAAGARLHARVGGRTQVREIRIGSNYLSQDPAIAHFGLDSATTVDELTVEWPHGPVTTLFDVAANQLLQLEAPP